MKPISVYIEPNDIFYPEIKYIWDVFCKNKDIKFIEGKDLSIADLVIGEAQTSDIKINTVFYEKLREGDNQRITFINSIPTSQKHSTYCIEVFFKHHCSLRLSSNAENYL